MTTEPTPIGVGILGAGPVVQAIHLPTLSRLTDRFAVRSIMDVDAAVATEVAARVGATPVTSIDELLADETVEVVAICSPQQFHAEQVIAAMRAGKRAVLCEKPLAVSREEAERIAEVSRETDVPLIVGAMHTFDPAWLESLPHIEQLRAEAHTIRSSIVLPPNDLFEDWATEVVQRPAPLPLDGLTEEQRAGFLPLLVLGLAIHDLPIVRAFLDEAPVRVSSAEFVPPVGYAIGVRSGDRIAEVHGVIHGGWQPQWRFEAISDRASLSIEFTPSFVHAGSGSAQYTDEHGTRVLGGADHNGYEGEWRAIAAAVHGDRSLVPPLESVIEDLVLAVGIVEGVTALQQQGVDA